MCQPVFCKQQQCYNIVRIIDMMSCISGADLPLWMRRSYDFIVFMVVFAWSAAPMRTSLKQLVNSWLRSLFMRAHRGLAHVLQFLFLFFLLSSLCLLKPRCLPSFHLSAKTHRTRRWCRVKDAHLFALQR